MGSRELPRLDRKFGRPSRAAEGDEQIGSQVGNGAITMESEAHCL